MILPVGCIKKVPLMGGGQVEVQVTSDGPEPRTVWAITTSEPKRWMLVKLVAKGKEDKGVLPQYLAMPR